MRIKCHFGLGQRKLIASLVTSHCLIVMIHFASNVLTLSFLVKYRLFILFVCLQKFACRSIENQAKEDENNKIETLSMINLNCLCARNNSVDDRELFYSMCWLIEDMKLKCTMFMILNKIQY